MTVLVAGIGNVFLGDDAFGVEVVRRLDPADVPAGVDVADYGIRGIHLAYELLDGRYDTLVLVDAVPLGQPPGTLAVLDATGRAGAGPGAVDAHAMSPDVVLAALHGLGGSIGEVLVVGCQPQTLAEGMGLSAPVRAAVERAVPLVLDLAREAAGPPSPTLAQSPGPDRRPVR
ncbi:hydrogenase maturation protease [Georgenia ruanii]|uniref:Hydrogenase maturation protease n=1 Tax=Georgenia ruanii TaxID=348442 RepID=A0A7J9URB8_9MICO|nr:hydrogenase maturation protease [Georgenia ruanii]MPV87167.1 hydrogenase maturation protease [Georgenia ruanii]